jgi:hypothetical protein
MSERSRGPLRLWGIGGSSQISKLPFGPPAFIGKQPGKIRDTATRTGQQSAIGRAGVRKGLFEARRCCPRQFSKLCAHMVRVVDHVLRRQRSVGRIISSPHSCTPHFLGLHHLALRGCNFFGFCLLRE